MTPLRLSAGPAPARGSYVLSVAATLAALLTASLPLHAQTSLPQNQGMTLYGQGCMQNVAGFALNCTANDVAIAGVAKDASGAYLLDIKDDGCAYPGDTVDFEATFDLVSNSKERHDIGVYFVEDADPNGDGAVTGSCSISTIPYNPDPPWLDLDGTTDPLPGSNTVSNLQDLCGDITKDRNPMRPKIRMTATCVDDDGNGYLDLPYCLSWRQSGSNYYCDSPLDAYPGSPSKCKCDDTFNVPIAVPPASLTVTKTVSLTEFGAYSDSVSLTEPGGSVWFKVRVENKGADPNNWVGLDQLTDSVYGNLDGRGTCDVSPAVRLDADGSDFYECLFQASLSGKNSGFSETDTVTASGLDQRVPANRLYGSDTATVTVGDALPAITVDKTASDTTLVEPGGMVTFTVTISNTSPASSDPVTITTISDDIHGNLNGQGTCGVPQTIEPGSSYSCSFTAGVFGNAGYYETDTVSASGTDDEGNPVSGYDSATVSILDAANDTGISVVKTANPETVYEPGGQVTFSVTVTNDSTVDVVYLNDLYDDIYGDLDGQGTCDVTPAVTLAKNGGWYSCEFTRYVALDAGEYQTDTITATGLDDDGNTVQDSDSATVTGLNVAPSATVVKTAVSGLVKFEITVTNTSTAESLALDALQDNVFGDVMDGSNPLIYSTTCMKQTLAVSGEAGDSYTCEFEAYVTESPHTNAVTATVNDDDGSAAATPSDSANVSFGEP